MQHRVLGSDRCVVEPCGNRMRERNLPSVILKDIRECPLQHAGRSALKTCGMFSECSAPSTGFDADQTDVFIRDEFVESANGVRSAANAGDDCVGQAALFLENLRPRFFADDAMEITHHLRVGMSAEHAT